nr:ribonuclease H-like domain-containing protein [Tanacetum cinerariifolium]
AERKNRTLIEAARTMLVDSLLPIPVWAEAVNTAYSLGKFDGKVDEGFLVGYSVSSKAFTVFNSRTRIVQETLHVNFLENKPNVAEKAGEEIVQQYVLFLVWSSGSTNPQNTDGDDAFNEKEPEFEGRKPESEVNVSLSSSAQSNKHDDKTNREAKGKKLEDITYFDDEEDVGAEADLNNLETSITVSLVPTTRVHKDHPMTQIIGDLSSATQSRSMIKIYVDDIIFGTTNKALCQSFEKLMKDKFQMSSMGELTFFLGLQVKQKKDGIFISQDKYVVEILRKFGLSKGKSASTPIDTEKPLLKDSDGEDVDVHTYSQSYSNNKSSQRSSCITSYWRNPRGNKARLVAQRHTEEEGIDYEEVFAPVARIEAIRLFLAYASFMGFMIYQMDVKSAFLYVKQKKEGIFSSQDKYVAEILRKFRLTEGKPASTPIDTEKPLLKDPDGEDVDVNTYKSMIDSLMDLTSSRPDIMFAVCAYARFQVTPKASHLHAEVYNQMMSIPWMQIDLLAMQEANSCCHFIH